MEETHAPNNCMVPPELTDIELIAAVDEEATSPVLAHLAACPSCAARARVFAELQAQLRQRLYRMFCPTSDELAFFSQRQLEPFEYDRVTAHLGECPRCQSELALLEAIIAVPPARPPSRSVRRVVAYPQRTQPQWLLGRQSRVYCAGMLRIVVDVEPGRGTAHPRLRGTLRGGKQNTTTASLLYGNHVVCSTTIDEHGCFTLDNIAPGDFALSFRLPDYEVVVEAIHVA